MKKKYKEGQARSNRISVSFTDAEYSTLQIESEKSGLPIAIFVRKLFIDNFSNEENK